MGWVFRLLESKKGNINLTTFIVEVILKLTTVFWVRMIFNWMTGSNKACAIAIAALNFAQDDYKYSRTWGALSFEG